MTRLSSTSITQPKRCLSSLKGLLVSRLDEIIGLVIIIKLFPTTIKWVLRFTLQFNLHFSTVGFMNLFEYAISALKVKQSERKNVNFCES